MSFERGTRYVSKNLLPADGLGMGGDAAGVGAVVPDRVADRPEEPVCGGSPERQ